MPVLDVWFGSEDTPKTVPGAKDQALTVRSFSVQERVSGLFEVALLAMSHDPDIDLESIVGQPAGFRIESAILHTQSRPRHWKGICRYLEQVRVETSEKGLCTYQLYIVPRLWLLTQRRNNRVFQHRSIPDIIDELLAEWSIEAEWKIDRGAYPELEYRVQYGETDYAFFSRLLEESGIAFTFPDEGHRGSLLTLSDRLSAEEPHKASPFPFVDEPSQSAEKDFISRVQMSHGVRPGALTIRDHGFRNPEYIYQGEAPRASGPESFYEQYHYRPGALLIEGGAGGDTPVADDHGMARPSEGHGRTRATRELAAERGGKRQITFETNVVDLLPGTVFTMTKHPHSALAPAHPLLVTELYLQGSPGGSWTTTGRAFFAEDPFFPPLVTPRPKILGLESATVVGPPGEEIHVDELGRARVQFPWDRKGTHDDRSSCWIRVSQGWAGLGFGMVALPRVGQEVLVGFLGGDPDQPILVGRVYNGKNKVPYKLPDHKTVSGWKSASVPGGDGFNELRFDDAVGKELVNIQAQRDLTKLVKHDETERTGNDHAHVVGHDQDLVVSGVKKERVGGDSHLVVEGARASSVGGKESLTVLGDHHEKVSGSFALAAGNEIRLIGDESLTIKGPGGFIRIDAHGITVQGLLVDINCGGFDLGSGPSPTTPLRADDGANPPSEEKS